MSAPSPNSEAPGDLRIWDVPLRLFHWLLVAAIALAFLSSGEDSALGQWHVLAGWLAGILIVFRIVWGFVGGEHSRFSDFVRPSGLAHHVRELMGGRPQPSLGHNALGALSVLLLLGLVAATVWTGVTLMGALHELIAWSLLGLVAIHVLAVFVMSILTRENLVRAMVTGKKPAMRHPGASNARRPRLVAFVIVLLVLAAAVFAVIRYDPEAFTLRSAEAYEHRGQVGGGAARDQETEAERTGRPDRD